VKGAFVQSVVLAGPGVLIGAALMGVLAKAILPYNWAWNLCMVFGAILSATDPVAVVSLLKSVGASPKLTILIVGESLMNDGTSMVLFTLFYNSINGTLYTAGSVIGFMFAAVVGSTALGIVIGLVMIWWLRTAYRPLEESDVLVQIAITLCCAYLTFFLAQNTFEISGVLACCGAGTVLCCLSPPLILSHESMHKVWGMVEWCLNTAIFLLAGLIIGHRVLSKVDPVDWIYMFIFYIATLIIRCITIVLLYPFIANIGHKCSVKEAAFMSWAGLRGALSMALALIVERTCPADIHKETSRVFFYVGGIAALTLLINATTAKAVLVKLGLLTKDSPERILATTQIKRRLRKETNLFIRMMIKEDEIDPRDVPRIKTSSSLLSGAAIPTITRESLMQNLAKNPLQAHNSGVVADSSTAVGDRRQGSASAVKAVRRMSALLSRSQVDAQSPAIIPELVHYVRNVFLEIVRVKYWHCIEVGKLPRRSFTAQFLLYSVEVGLDEVTAEHGARDWACIVTELDHIPLAHRLCSYYQTVMPRKYTTWSAQLLGFLVAQKEKRDVYMLNAFIDAHEQAQKKIHSFLGVDEAWEVDNDNEEGDGEGEGKRGSRESKPGPEEEQVINESRRVVEDAKARLFKVDPGVVASIKSAQSAHLVFAKQVELVKDMVSEGLIASQDGEKIIDEISADGSKIEKERALSYWQVVVKKAEAMQAVKEEIERESMALANEEAIREGSFFKSVRNTASLSRRFLSSPVKVTSVSPPSSPSNGREGAGSSAEAGGGFGAGSAHTIRAVFDVVHGKLQHV
ncbi:sodium:proton antiporter, partial [archaeon]